MLLQRKNIYPQNISKVKIAPAVKQLSVSDDITKPAIESTFHKCPHVDHPVLL